MVRSGTPLTSSKVLHLTVFEMREVVIRKSVERYIAETTGDLGGESGYGEGYKKYSRLLLGEVIHIARLGLVFLF